MNAIIGIIIVILGIIFLGDNLGWFNYNIGDLISDWWPGALILIGGWMIFNQTRKKDQNEWEDKVGNVVSKAIGDRQLKPGEIPAAGLTIKQGAGDLMLDLTATRLHEGENQVRCSLGAGDIKVSLPTGIAAKIVASCGAGDVRLFGKKEDGISPKLEHEDDNYGSAATKINLTARVGLGEIKVTRE